MIRATNYRTSQSSCDKFYISLSVYGSWMREFNAPHTKYKFLNRSRNQICYYLHIPYSTKLWVCVRAKYVLLFSYINLRKSSFIKMQTCGNWFLFTYASGRRCIVSRILNHPLNAYKNKFVLNWVQTRPATSEFSSYWL